MSATEPAATTPRSGRTGVILLMLAVLVLATAGLRLCLGQTGWGWPGGNVLGTALRTLWPSTADAPLTVLDIRFLRVSGAVLVGAALAASGLALQGLLRNPLAEPFILGLSSGAAVGIMAQWLVQYHIGRPLGASHLGAVIGAAASALVVYAASRRRGVLDPLGLLLTGVVLGTLNAAAVMLLNYLATPAGLREDLARWMMGYLSEGVAAPTVMSVAGLTLAGLVVLWWAGRAMDVATFSDIEALSMGVNLGLVRTLLFIIASALAAGAVVLAGPIGFVGLICPHLGRLLLGPSHRPLLVASALLGALLVLLADSAAAGIDLALGIGILPIGIFTALLGGPLFLWMLHPSLGRGSE